MHAPFKEDAEAERNDTSIALQVTLKTAGASCRALLFGDLSNPTVNRIFSISDEADLEWNVLLAPHHCSKTVMYVANDDGNDVLDRELMSRMDDAGGECRYIVSSSEPIPSRNQSGDNPPHAKAKNRYEEIVETGHFLCTQERPSEDKPGTDSCTSFRRRLRPRSGYRIHCKPFWGRIGCHHRGARDRHSTNQTGWLWGVMNVSPGQPERTPRPGINCPMGGCSRNNRGDRTQRRGWPSKRGDRSLAQGCCSVHKWHSVAAKGTVFSTSPT